MIPKLIHWCWFGGKEIPETNKKCIASWPKILPQNYRFMLWNESNFDVESCRFSADAYKTGNYAFVSDFARWKVLHQYGGVYLDSDVLLIKDFTPLLSEYKAFGGTNTNGMFASGLIIAAIAGNEIVAEMVARYEKRNFLTKDGKPIYLVDTAFESAILEEHGFHPGRDEFEMVGDFAIFPSEYFCANNPNDGGECFTRNTYAVHKFTSLWKPQFMINAEKRKNNKK